MKSVFPALMAVLLPLCAAAGERVAGTNSYILREESWPAGQGAYWRQDNSGEYAVSEGPLEPGFVRCIGAGFADAAGVSGEGICVFEAPSGTFTWTWRARKGDVNAWTVVGGTGRYAGMTGGGTATSRIDSKFRALQHRVTDWQGEVELRE